MNKILIIGPAWVGDMIMAQTLFKLIRQRHPSIHIDVLAPEWSFPLLACMPEVNRALISPFAHGEFALHKRWQIGKQLRANKYDQAIVLQNSFKSAFIPFFARISVRTGWLGEVRWFFLNDVRYLNKKKLPLMIQRFMALGLKKNESLPERLLWPSLVVDKNAVANTLQKYQLSDLTKPILALCPGAEYGPAKRWPAEYFAEVAKEKIKQGWAVWIFGSLKDQPIAENIQKLCHHACSDLTGKTSLEEAIHLLSVSQRVVSNDSGLMHIAAALQRPLVVLYGSSSPQFTPPLTDKVKIISSQLPCSPCFKRECPLQHFKCMKELSPKYVLQSLEEF